MMLTCAICVSLVGALAAGSPKTEAPAKSAILLTVPKLEWEDIKARKPMAEPPYLVQPRADASS